MDHPHIARVLDAGTTESGLPYFVMELVRGLPITDYCDKNHLTPKERLQLFITVCHAIQHAHQKGIIHRDIKPSNILVGSNDGKPMAKVIDFGVAKAISQDLSQHTIYTNFAQMIGTPLYMSPEQAEMSVLDIDTRSDIYLLGVLLYELLTGSTPLDKQRFAKAAYDEIRCMIREDEPPKPSHRLSTCDTLPSLAACRRTEPVQLSRMLKGELDWVVMKALEKDRTRRYETANGLARDIQRYLNDEVVEARPPSTGYRLHKFVCRHKGQVIAASLLLLILLGGIAGTTLGLIAARRQEQEAKRQEAAAHSYADEANTQAQLASDNAQRAETEARSARKAEQEARDRATAEAAAKALALQEKQRADDNAQKAEERARAACQAEEEVKVQLTRAEWLVYASKLSLAQNDFETGNGALALKYLNDCQWNQRGWEHRYLWTRVNAKQTLREAGGVLCVAISPDGKRIVTGNQNTRVKVWDAATGRELLVLNGHTNPVRGVAISADGQRSATGDGDPGRPAEMKVWDAATGQEVLNVKGFAGEINSVAISPDGKRVVTGGGDRTGSTGESKVWDAETGQELLAIKTASGVNNVAISRDGKRLVAGEYDGTVEVWGAETGQERLSNAENAELVRDRFSSLLRGTDQPADNAERLGFSYIAFEQKKFALAARLWAEALANDPQLGDDRQTLHRYNAACAAALAAAGQGSDEPPLDDAAKSRLRGQALDWLQAELSAWSESLESGSPQERQTILLKLSGWQHDRALSDIRDATALSDLPADEQSRVTKFWADVAAVLKAYE